MQHIFITEQSRQHCVQPPTWWTITITTLRLPHITLAQHCHFQECTPSIKQGMTVPMFQRNILPLSSSHSVSPDFPPPPIGLLGHNFSQSLCPWRKTLQRDTALFTPLDFPRAPVLVQPLLVYFSITNSMEPSPS
jgi:hypothetical protein